MDGEEPTKQNYDKSRRIERGLFRSNSGLLINSDVNGYLQIMMKVFPNAFNIRYAIGGSNPYSYKCSVSCVSYYECVCHIPNRISKWLKKYL